MPAKQLQKLGSEHYSQSPTPLWLAFDRFSRTLDQEEKATFAGTTLEKLILTVKDLDRQHAASSKTRTISDRLQPFIDFLDRHAKALDCMVQAQPNPSALIWGILRIILEAAGSFSRYFKKLIAMVEKLGNSFSLYREYESFLGHNERFRIALGGIYYDALLFLKKTKQIFVLRGSKHLFRSLWRTFELDFEDILAEITKHTNMLHEEIALAHRENLQRGLETQLEGQRSFGEALKRIEDLVNWRRKLMEWLSPFDMEEVFIRESKKRCQPCGLWLLEHEDFQEWLHSVNPQRIWVTGLPGTGKTILSTSIIEAVRSHIKNDPKSLLVFFYIEKGYENSLSLTSILASIIAQILAQFDSIPERISAAYRIAERYGRRKISTADQPRAILKDIISSLKKLYVLVDGLDEFKDSLTVIEAFKDLDDMAIVQVIFLSREVPAIRSHLGGFKRITLTPAVTTTDINNYIKLHLQHLPLDNVELRDHIFDKISGSANGMFLWASLMIQTIRTATSPHEIKGCLENIPIGIHIIYRGILDKISKEPLKRGLLAKRVLLLICCSARPLRWTELESALAFDRLSLTMDESKKPFRSAVLELCSPLVEHAPESDVFRLTHLSVREFLLNAGACLPGEPTSQLFIEVDCAHQELAQLCMAYQYWHDTQDQTNTDHLVYPFLEYATLFWCHHLSSSSYHSIINQIVIQFLSLQLRRQGWILRYLFWQPSVFPLQFLMKQRKLVKDWMVGASKTNIQDRLFDWIQDVQEVLLCATKFNDEEKLNIKFLKEMMPKISYFEKMMVIRDLSREYTMSGKLVEGERWLKDALGSQQRLLGPDHISSVWLMNSLGIIYDQQQKFEISASTQEQALAIQECALGPNHLETIWTVNELGRIYRHLGRFEKAEIMHLQALQKLSPALPPNDLQIAWTLNTLARSYRRQGRFEEAISLHEKALAIQKEVLGQGHPHTLWALMDLAGCYRGQGKLRSSAQLYQKALEGREQALGPRHADTLWALNDLGLVLQELGEINAAIKVQEKALHGQIELLGSEHVHAIWTGEVIQQLLTLRR